jgi:hypothetical protein
VCTHGGSDTVDIACARSKKTIQSTFCVVSPLIHHIDNSEAIHDQTDPIIDDIFSHIFPKIENGHNIASPIPSSPVPITQEKKLSLLGS